MIQLKVKSILSICFLLHLIFSTKVSRAKELERVFRTSCKNQSRLDIVQVQLHKKPFYIKCNQEIEDGGWTVVLRRYDGEQNFNCSWNDCVKGFGNIDGEFFIGLERLHEITSYTLHELMFILEDFENETRTAKYAGFAIEDESKAYMIYLLGNYSGNVENSFEHSAGRKFSTNDKDHTNGCTTEYKAAPGWHNWCLSANLFGKYLNGSYEAESYIKTTGMYWDGFHNRKYSLKRITMMIRPIDQ